MFTVITFLIYLQNSALLKCDQKEKAIYMFLSYVWITLEKNLVIVTFNGKMSMWSTLCTCF